MDATLTLALMMKAKLVFERDSNFFCFPLSPISYAPNDLSFLTSPMASAADLESLSGFSMLVNMIPDDVMWPPKETTFLWDAYGDVLRNAQLAQSTRTSDEEQQYEAAVATLYATNADATRTPTPALVAYDQCRDAYIVAEQNYTMAKSTAQTSTDDAVKTQWATQGPALLADVTDANDAWIAQGFKEEIDDARGVTERLGAKAPELTWQSWTAAFDPKTGALTDAGGLQFYPAAPSPANVFEPGAEWQQFTLTGDEAKDLIAQAPADLHARLGSQPLDVAIEKVTFEYASVQLKRAWFDPDVFAQRYWRFSDAHVVSDGASLGSGGTCPAYVSGLVFARNVQVQLGTPTPQNTATFNRFQAGEALNLGFVALRQAPAASVATNGTPGTQRLLLSAVDRPAVATLARPLVASAAVARTAPVATASAPAISNRGLSSIALAHFTRRFPPQPAPAPSTPPPAPPVDPSTMYVLGFLCSHVPQSPNPDPTLTWS